MSTRRLLPLLLALGVAGLLLPADTLAQRVRQGLVTLDDARIFYEVLGTGAPIVVVHGGPGLDHTYLRPGLDVLGARNELVYYDQRGTGRSTTEVGPETISLESFVQDLDAVREALGHPTVHVLTHSFGSRIGLAYARRHPERVRSLILLNPVEPGTRFRSATAARQAQRRATADSLELATLTTSEGFAAHDPAILSRVFQVAFRAAMRDPDRVVDLDLALRPATARNGQEIARLLGGELATLDGWDLLGEIEAPTLIVHGRHDLPPTEMVEEMAANLPDGRIDILDTGHFPFVEDRDALLASVSAFLAGLPSR